MIVYFSDEAQAVIDTLQLAGETPEQCVERLIENLVPISTTADEYEHFFGEQAPNTRPNVPAEEPATPCSTRPYPARS